MLLNGSCYYLLIFAVYEVAYLNQICTTNCSSAPARGTCGKLDYCSQSSLLVTGLCIHTLFYARCISSEQSVLSTWLDLANGMSADMTSDFFSCIPDHIYGTLVCIFWALLFIILLTCHNLVNWVLFSHHLSQIRKLRPRETKYLAQSHTSMDAWLNPDSLACWPCHLIAWRHW